LDDTWATELNGSKIVSFNINGNLNFDVRLPPSRICSDLISGDVDSDGENDIIAVYRPRYGGDSGIMIFDLRGKLKREINIPTTGYFETLFGLMLTDFNMDGAFDIILLSDYAGLEDNEGATRIYVLNLGGKYENGSSWPMYQHDPQHSGTYSKSISVEPPKCIWDLYSPSAQNQPDGKVNLGDVLFVLKDFGKSPGDPDYDSRKNFNNNPKIDLGDVLTVLAHFGNCPS
jgi:hypothetical protein